MHCTRFNKEEVTLFYLNKSCIIGQSVAFDCLPEPFGGDFILKAEQKLGVFVAVDDIPTFRFAVFVFYAQSVIVVRMHLYR